MKPHPLPTHRLSQFVDSHEYLDKKGFYSNLLSEHLRAYPFVRDAHRHDFYLCGICTAGAGTHTIDFITYQVHPSYVFIISPGQAHSFNVSPDTEGYLLFHSREFYEVNSFAQKLREYPFFCSAYTSRSIHLEPNTYKLILPMFLNIYHEYYAENLLKYQMLHSLLEQLYIALSRVYLPVHLAKYSDISHVDRLNELEDLIEVNFLKTRSAGDYAAMMHLSERHLNRVVRLAVNKNVSDLIFDRVILEAKRLLFHSGYTVSEVAEKLGYEDHSYFSRLFKKRTGETPLDFLRRERLTV